MNPEDIEYAFDTSSFIYLKHYPEDLFPTIWETLNLDFEDGKIVIIQDVLEEISRVDDFINEFVNDHLDCVMELDEDTQNSLIRVINDFPDWINPSDTRNQADPSLIALALNLNIKIVTQERERGDRLKIPYVCKHYGIECMDLLGYLREHSIRL